MSKRRTAEQRIAMVRLYSKFENAHEVRRQFLSVNRKFDETRVVKDLPRSALFEEKLKEMEELVINSPRLSVRQGAAQAGISKSTYQSVMEKLNFKPDRPTLIVHLNEDDFDRRSEFCEIWLDKFENDSDLLDRIFWSDEAKFSMNSTVNQHNCTYWARENQHLNFEVPNNQQGIMVWCGISSNGLIGPYIFNDTVSGSSYKEMLIEYVWPRIKRNAFYFQHDGAGAHYAIIVRKWLTWTIRLVSAFA